MVAGQVYAADPDRWETMRRPDYDRLAIFAWALADSVVKLREARKKRELEDLIKRDG
jgi:hypothetical protein